MSYDTLTVVHALCGGVALLAGAWAAFSSKGSRIHVTAGRIFAPFMALTAVSAITLAVWRPDPFLLGIGLFTGYLVASGWAWIRPAPLDTRIRRARIAAAAGFVAAGFLAVLAILQGRRPVVLFVFAGITTALSLVDWMRRPGASEVAARHGGRMGGAYIAALTAFLVVNVEALPDLILWLGPTLVGTPLIALAIRRHRQRHERRDDARGRADPEGDRPESEAHPPSHSRNG